jgi:LmbE family N-acetylglucosaminyl deacetylase
MAGASALVIAPHPDDETFGCGGTVAALAASGVDVFVQVIVQHSINTGGPDTEVLPAERGEELSRACHKLGVAAHHTMYEEADHHDVLHSDLAKMVEFLEKTSPISIDRVRPQVVLLPARSAFHQDHKVVHQAAFAACRNRGSGHYSPPVVLGYQCPEDSWSPDPEPITCSVDVTANYSSKQAAIECYHRQVKPDPHLRSMSSIERSDALRGAALGVHYAESFITYRTSLSFAFGSHQMW